MDKNKKNKILKIFLIILVVIIPLAIIIACFVDWNFPPWIYISGSSTMQPLLKDISKLYNNAEIIVDGVGSSQGISNFLSNKKDIASISKYPSKEIAGLPNDNSLQISDSGTYSKQWNEYKIKTLTLAWDGIGIIYKENNPNLNIQIDINQNNICNFYNSFANNEYYFIHENNSIDTTQQNGLKLIPFARSGGSNVSGTAEAFIDNSNFDLSELSSQTKQNLKTGNYPNWVIQTSESNLQTWNKIKDYNFNNNEIIITYLSAGFIYNNQNEILNKGFKIATYNKFNLIQDNKLNIPGEYKWYRPFNLLFKLNPSNEAINNFILWLETELSNSNSELVNLLIKMGYKPLTQTEWNTMKLNNSILVSDYEILQNPEQYDKRNNNKIWYGAY